MTATLRRRGLSHELAHVWIGASGVSGPLRDVPEKVIEDFQLYRVLQFSIPP